MPKAPLTVDQLADQLAVLGGFEARPLVAVAVSGGPDSLALMLLADRWARQRGGTAWGLIVDHGLRPESAAEARTVAGWLAARSIPHEVLPWRGEKPTSRVQEKAREARYRLLTEWCQAHGVLHIFTAHQREDQAETYLIRRRAGSGVDGLAAMSGIREVPGCRLVRPLLAVPRARLLALLEQERQPFLTDPSNLNPVFERGRLRLGRITAVDDTLAAICAAGAARIERERALDALIGRAVGLHPAGFAVVDPAPVFTAGDDLGERLLGRVAATIGGARYPARRDRVARLRAGLIADPERAHTLGGCRFVPWRGRLLVLREAAAASPAVRLDANTAVGWDRRFVATLAANAYARFSLGCLGHHTVPGIVRDAGGVPRLVYPVLPVLWDEAGLAAVPHLGFRRAGVGKLPRLLFRPVHALTRARFTVV